MHGGITAVNRSAGSGARPSAVSFCEPGLLLFMVAGFCSSEGTAREGIASRETGHGPERCISRLVCQALAQSMSCKKKHHDPDGFVTLVQASYLSPFVTFCKLRHAHRICAITIGPVQALLSMSE